jgi:hypothetical protein
MKSTLQHLALYLLLQVILRYERSKYIFPHNSFRNYDCILKVVSFPRHKCNLSGFFPMQVHRLRLHILRIEYLTFFNFLSFHNNRLKVTHVFWFVLMNLVISNVSHHHQSLQIFLVRSCRSTDNNFIQHQHNSTTPSPSAQATRESQYYFSFNTCTNNWSFRIQATELPGASYLIPSVHG